MTKEKKPDGRKNNRPPRTRWATTKELLKMRRENNPNYERDNPVLPEFSANPLQDLLKEIAKDEKK